MKTLRKFMVLFAAVILVAGCSTPASETYTYADTIVWDAQYDVVVAGFGAAGASAAKSAAENGSEVLLVEKMSEGLSGGNSKVAGQVFINGKGNVENTYNYLKAMAGDHEIDDEILQVMAKEIANIEENWVTNYGLNSEDFMDNGLLPQAAGYSPEFPELPGSESIGMFNLHKGASDSYMYQIMKQAVLDKSENIDIWFESPAVHLIQDPMSKTIIGVQVQRDGKMMNIRALNGVILCTGGFESNKQMVQDYIGLVDYAEFGGQYNTGDGIRMAMEVGADLWHMHVYEGGMGTGGVSYFVGEDENGVMLSMLGKNPLNTGAVVLVGNGGERFLNETEPLKHGHQYMNESYYNPTYPEKMWVIYDQTQADKIAEKNFIPERFLSGILSSDSISGLAEQIGVDAAILTETIEDYNRFAANGKDEEFDRDAETMSAFDNVMYYALPVKAAILNTQGGPRKNANAEILDVNGNVIPNLYSAGEMGGMTTHLYQGGTNLAECLIFGQIAGKNASVPKPELPAYVLNEKVASTPASLGEITDVIEPKEYETKENEYIGVGTGMGGDVVIKVTMNGDKIENVEILEHNETEGISDPAIETLPQAIVDNNGTDGVDTVSKATITSKAIIQAVNDALSKK
ncbi:FAD-binding protein [Dielma fastidiosa]|nr:FAD-binding protein [Dielma fastidiosa]